MRFGTSKKLLTLKTKNMRISCEECGKEFQKRTKKEAEMAVRMHKGRVHGNIKNGTKEHQDAPKGTRKELTEDQKEHRRQYLRDLRAKQKAQRNGVSAHFCPRCGLNLDVLATALSVVNKV